MLAFDESGTLVYQEDVIAKTKEFIEKLKAKGVTKIVGSNTYYMYPFGEERSYWLSVPEPGTALYTEFLELIETGYKMVAERFPEITDFTVGNELNAPRGHNLSKNGFKPDMTAEEKAPYVFTTSEQGMITADIGYYASRGIKAVNPNAKVIMPGPYMPDDGYPYDYFKAIYDHIASGNLPSSVNDTDGGRKIPADSDPWHYFDVMNFHPYIGSGGAHDSAWLDLHESFYKIAVDHNHICSIIADEFGYFDSLLERREEAIADACVPAIVALTQRLPNIETIIIFRLCNWMSCPPDVAVAEKSFGIFDSPYQPGGARPKPVAFSLFYHFNGLDANSDDLYIHAQ
jgi:hypothetical protein